MFYTELSPKFPRRDAELDFCFARGDKYKIPKNKKPLWGRFFCFCSEAEKIEKWGNENMKFLKKYFCKIRKNIYNQHNFKIL